ncbi:MAG TPA: hypothetical protein VEU96_16805 [Bryobacteraceae bacterium]|nr:hypothetical protein [Bryobacteraceae bacterium]
MTTRLLIPLALLLPLQAAIRVGTFPQEVRTFYTSADGLPSDDVLDVAASDGKIYARTSQGVSVFLAGKWTAADPTQVKFRQGSARLAATDSKGNIWVAHAEAVERRGGGRVKAYTAADGLPYDDFTSVAATGDGLVWFGTHKGAIRFDGTTWEYRQGLRWLPDDDVRGVAVEANGNAWFATKNGVGLISHRPVTLAEKAKFFEDEIDKRHRRTPYEYVESVNLKHPGDLSEWTQHDTDNDGLWTAMYGAGECFDYAATHSEAAQKRAKAAFEALRFLRIVTQGGEHPALPGFVARSILPTSGPNPNRTESSPEEDARMRQRDGLWKKLSPRWPVSADGKWYWKADTSSDELDGHYFFYALYYDLVASTNEEKHRVREQVAAITDHLIDHGFKLIDHDGKPTRWGIFDPEDLNHSPNWWSERSLNSLSILAYLKVAEHVTADPKYHVAYRKLIDQHSYDQNVLIPKSNAGPGSGNQSDDEMAFMGFYNLIRYETDPVLLRKYTLSFYHYWTMERPELNPLFNFLYAAVNSGKVFTSAFGAEPLSPTGDWLEESVDTLRRYPLDRVNWRVLNSHRKDIVPLPSYARERGDRGRGFRNNGKVLPIDERFVDHWNQDPWQLDQGGNGMQLADGASFLLPYYLGLYHRFIGD